MPRTAGFCDGRILSGFQVAPPGPARAVVDHGLAVPGHPGRPPSVGQPGEVAGFGIDLEQGVARHRHPPREERAAVRCPVDVPDVAEARGQEALLPGVRRPDREVVVAVAHGAPERHVQQALAVGRPRDPRRGAVVPRRDRCGRHEHLAGLEVDLAEVEAARRRDRSGSRGRRPGPCRAPWSTCRSPSSGAPVLPAACPPATRTAQMSHVPERSLRKSRRLPSGVQSSNSSSAGCPATTTSLRPSAVIT